MIRIRCGDRWRHDPALHAALRRSTGLARAATARAVVDALALEVDGIDLAAGRAEGPLLPSLEAVLRAIARVVAGAPHANVALSDGELEIVIRRRGASALLTVVAVSRPSHVLARDVEVEIEDLAAAALQASADLCRELSEVLPGFGTREARGLRAAARDLRRTEAAPPRRARAPRRNREPRPATRKGRVALDLEISDDEGLLAGYEGGRPDLGSLLVPGRLALRAPDGREITTLPGIPFLTLRDLGAATERLVAAVLRGDREHEIPLPRSGRAAPGSLLLDLAAGRLLPPGGAPPESCPPLDLARAVCETAIELGRVARARNPRQAENGYLVEMEGSAADRLAQLDEIALGDLAPSSPGEREHRFRGGVSQRALGPGRLRRLTFRKVWTVDAGTPAGEGLLLAGGAVVVAGAAVVAAVERASGRPLWRREGARFAAALPGAILLAGTDGVISALAPRTGRTLWSRPLAGAPISSATALPRGPFVLAEPGALTALDPGSGRTLWRLEPPGATRLGVVAGAGLAIAGADTGTMYGIDAGGGVVWRIRARGPIVRPPSLARDLCLAVSAADPGASLLAVEAASGTRLWETPLDAIPTSGPLPWGRLLSVAALVAGDAIVSALDRSGAALWTVAPPLLGTGQPVLAAGSSLHVRDSGGALVALGRDGTVRWGQPARKGHATIGTAAPVVVRGTVVTPSGEGLAALDARTGEILGVIPGASPARLAVDAALGVSAMDLDGVASGWRLATHLSVV